MSNISVQTQNKSPRESIDLPLRILMVEDDPDDAELITLALADAGLHAEFQRVESASEMEAALAESQFDVILSDYSIPGFGGREALELMQTSELDIPFIIISGEIGEDAAVDLMKAGVHDYVAKGRLARLAPVIQREVREAGIRQARRQTEQSLHESQQRHAALIQSLDGIVWESGPELGPLRFVSRQAETLLGFDVQNWIEDPDFWRNNIHAEDRAWVLDAYAKAISERRHFQVEYRRISRQGDVHWLREVVSITQDRDHCLLRGVSFDVTERRAAEDERERLLSLTEQRAREMSTIADISAALRSVVTRHETLTIVMQSLRRLLPFRALSFHPYTNNSIGESEIDVGQWPAGYLDQLITDPGIQGIISSAYESVVLPPVPDPDAETPGRAIGLPLRAQGNLIGVVWGYYQPPRIDENVTRPLSVTENRLLTALADIVAAALYRAGLYEETQIMARQMEEMMSATPQGLVLLDQNNRIILANPAARAALRWLATGGDENGDSDGEGEGEGDGDVTHVTQLGDRPIALDIDSTTATESRFEVSVEGPPGKIFEVILRPLNTEFTLQSWLLSLIDVTAERLEQERQQKQHRLAAVGQLAAGIAHDFNNSLGVIRLYTDLVQRNADLAERDRERMQTVSKQIGHATHLIHQILDFSRRSMIERKTLNLESLVRELLGILEHTLGKNISLHFDHDQQECTVQGDRTRLQQALFNLAVNARDAMPNGGEITFGLRSFTVESEQSTAPPAELARNSLTQAELTPGAWTALTIRDTGHGIEEKLLPQLFEPFFTTKPAGHGTGLGLAQVYGIVKQHDGHITVDTQPGIGTSFTLYFPLYVLDHEQETPAAPSLETASNRKILLVEDDPAGREALCETLQEYGYRVGTAENGLDALDRLAAANNDYDLIVSDLVMPRMNGTQLFEHLKTNQIDIPMIIITGYPLADGGQELLEQGVVDWLSKPFNADVLRQKIEAALP